jgi:hypothetical protein
LREHIQEYQKEWKRDIYIIGKSIVKRGKNENEDWNNSGISFYSSFVSQLCWRGTIQSNTDSDSAPTVSPTSTPTATATPPTELKLKVGETAATSKEEVTVKFAQLVKYYI